MSDNYQKSSGGVYIPKDTAYYQESPWECRIEAANKFYTEWQGRYKCKMLEDYYKGQQWKGRRDYPTSNYMPYMLNLINSTIKIKLAGLIFQKPKFILSPRSGNSAWNQEFAVHSAQLKEDVLNTVITNPNLNFAKNIKRAARDSFLRFGIVEIGYANDWRNPQKTDPVLESWENPEIDEKDDRILEDEDLPVNERIYVKRIRPQRFRVAVSEAEDLNDLDWFGYYDYYYTSTLRNSKGIKWPSGYDCDSYVSADYATGYVGADKNDAYHQSLLQGKISRVWHIWDNVSKKRMLLLDSNEMRELASSDYDTHPFVDIRWDEEMEGFYPIPPVFQWLSPQDEINEAREQTRSYRRRFTRKFQYVKGSVDQEELEKFFSGPDGIGIEVKQDGALKPIDNPEQGPTAENALLLAKDDFNIISGTSAEARGQNADRETATQAKLVDARSQIRESAEQLDFTEFLAQVGRKVLVTIQERFTEGVYIQATHNPGPDNPQEMQVMGPVYEYVSSQQISDGYDYDIEFDVMNSTPAAMQASQQAFVNFLAILNNPMVMMSPKMIREAAYRVGYKNESIIQEAIQAAQVHAQMQAQQMQEQSQSQGQQGNNPQNQGKTQRAQMASPSLPEIGNQLAGQLQ